MPDELGPRLLVSGYERRERERLDAMDLLNRLQVVRFATRNLHEREVVGLGNQDL
jgi:hypothetical protein